MSWLTNFVRPKIQALMRKKEVPDNMWHKCPSCESMLFHKDLVQNLHVCTHCDHHLRISGKQRLSLLFDGGSYERIVFAQKTTDPLKYKDTKKYAERLKTYRAKTGEDDAIIVGVGKIEGVEMVVAAFDFFFMGGSMGLAVGEGLLKAAETAVERKLPLITIPASGGARMQEGILSLMQLPRSVVAVDMVREAKLPYIVVISDPTTGGVSASFAMLGDIALAEPRATIGFSGARVIEQNLRVTLPEGFQTSEFLLDHGMVDQVVARKDIPSTLARIVKLVQNPYQDKLLSKVA